MAKKAELEQAFERYRRSCEAAARHESARALHDAVREAEASLPLVHPAVTYQRRFLKADVPDAPTLDCLLRHAPPLFLAAALDAAERWYAGGTRAERAALPDVPRRLADARALMGRALELWSALAAAPGATVRPDARDPRDAQVVSAWLAAGAVVPVARPAARPGPAEYARCGDPRRAARGKCSACGHLLAAPLARLLAPFPCPACRAATEFVLAGPAAPRPE
jgi:hypothetical protein